MVLRQDKISFGGTKTFVSTAANDFKTNELTVDHVLPRSKGGKNTWENLVAACKPCNQKKGAKTAVDEADMHPIRKPYVPKRYNTQKCI